MLKGYVIERRSCDFAPMFCFLPPPVNLPIGASGSRGRAAGGLPAAQPREYPNRKQRLENLIVRGLVGRGELFCARAHRSAHGTKKFGNILREGRARLATIPCLYIT